MSVYREYNRPLNPPGRAITPAVSEELNPAPEDLADEEQDEDEEAEPLVAFDASEDPLAWVELVRRDYAGYSSKEAFREAEHLYNKRNGVLPDETEDWANA